MLIRQLYFLNITSANEHQFSQIFHCEIVQEIFYRPPPHLRCVAALPCEIWKSNIFVFQKQSLPLLIMFFYSRLWVAAEQSGSEPRQLRGVGDPTTACVQAPQDHGRGRAAPACWRGMGPSKPGSDWQCNQWMAQATDSQRRTFRTFNLNITAFVHTPLNMFWTLLTLLSVKQINFSCTSNIVAVIVNFWISQDSVAT